jgi:hypothetical protein
MNIHLKIVEVRGEAYTRSTDGTLRLVKPGDVLHEGDILVTRSGSVILEDHEGTTLELLPNHSFTLNAAALDNHPEGLVQNSSGVEPAEGQGGEQDIPASRSVGDQNTLQQAQEEDVEAQVLEKEGHGFVRLPRTSYDYGNPLLTDHSQGRDVNEIHDFHGRHTLNPRVRYTSRFQP